MQLFWRIKSYDFIVVGAGSAGSAIANRLTEVHDWKVLLIEAGSDPPIESEIPAFTSLLSGSKHDWSYMTERSDIACQAMVNKQCLWPKGKMLGGSSSMNGMYYVRGNEEDYNDWQKAGNPGWAYKDVLKYFKKLEDVSEPRVTPGIHGQNGYLHAEYMFNVTSYHTPLVEKLIAEAAVELGIPFIEDCSSNVRTCITIPLFTMKYGRRMSAAKAYLASIKERDNLLVMKKAVATKLLIDEERRVYGVEVYVNGKFVNLLSKKEVIVSAGSIGSPQLLLLSGIGPREDLEKLGIRLVNDLKVGYNLQDHVYLNNYFAHLNLPDDSYAALTDPMYFYLTRRSEALSRSCNPPLLFASVSNTTLEDRPNIQFHFWNSPPKNPIIADYLRTLNYKREIVHSFLEANQHRHLLSFHVKLLRPKSRGRVTLSSSDPLAAPKVINGYFSDEEDVKTLIEGMKLADKMMKSNSFQKLGSKRYTLPVAECDRFDGNSDQFYECYIRHFANTVYHAVGTCKMGPKSDPSAVVDASLKVHGIDGLRVADASIMPTILSGNINVPTIMIGEKAADMMKEEWLKKTSSSEL